MNRLFFNRLPNLNKLIMSKKRLQTSVKLKLLIINKLKEGKSIRSVARDFGVPESNIRFWLKQEDKLRSMVMDNSVQVNSRKRLFELEDNLSLDKLKQN
jgi:transposase-like protein